MSARVVVTGRGYVTALGFGDGDHEAPLREGRTAGSPITRFDTAGFRTSMGGQCDEARLDRLLAARLPSAPRRALGIGTRMILWAAAEAVHDSSLKVDRPVPAVIGTTLGGFDNGEAWYEGVCRGRGRAAHLRDATGGAQVAIVAAHLGIPLEPAVVSNACATGVTAIGRIWRRIRSGEITAGLAGGYDCLSPFIHLGFDSLGALTPDRCTPFDRKRRGFFIGDGAAVLVLESLDAARARGARILAEILGYAQVVEGYHLAQPEPNGAGIARAIGAALDSASIEPSEVGYINAHGTATPANDGAEARGILAALGTEDGRRVRVSSTKALVGHTLGGAGAVEQCFCILAGLKGFIPPQANLQEPDPVATLRFAAGDGGPPGIMLNHSFGFGGVNGVVVSRAWDREEGA